MQALTTTNPGTEALVNPALARDQRPWLQDLALWILLIGPLTAPFFMWLGWGVLKPFADGIYLIGDIVCPKVDVHLDFLGYPMSVCSSCWAAVWGLWVVRLLYGRASEGLGPFSRLGLGPFWTRWSAVPLGAKIVMLFIGFIPWTLDVVLYDLNAWSSPQGYMIFAGFLGGLIAGLILIPAAAERRAYLAASKQVD